MKTLLLLIVILPVMGSITSCKEKNRAGAWTHKPNNYKNFKYDEDDHWVWDYSSVIIDGKYVIGVGGYASFPDSEGVSDFSDKDYSFYAIDIEIKNGGKSLVLDELSFDLSLVSEEFLAKSAKQIVIFDKVTRVVTFDFGKSKFKYKLP